MIGWFAIYIAAGIVAIVFETGLVEKGLVSSDKAVFILQAIGVLLALSMIPVALGGFKKMMDRLEDKPFEKRVRIYSVCSWLRLAAFFIVVTFSVLLYYLINDDIGLYCAVIGAICSMFCFPTKGMVEYDVDWNEEED